MEGYMPEMVDHRDGNRLNNKWANLRDATRAENLWNSKRPTTNTTGVKGLSYTVRLSRYEAQVIKHGKVYKKKLEYVH